MFLSSRNLSSLVPYSEPFDFRDSRPTMADLYHEKVSVSMFILAEPIS